MASGEKTRKFRGWFANKHFFRPGLDRFYLISVIALYALATISLVFGAICSGGWVKKTVSTTFIASVVIVPIFSIAVAFGIQIIALLRDTRDREERIRSESKFLSALDRCHGTSVIMRNFFGHLLDDWDVRISHLEQGIITVQEDYWLVCADMYSLTNSLLECTSSVPIQYWDQTHQGNRALLQYKDMQIERLIKRDIVVRRTFILKSVKPSEQLKLFLDIATMQLEEGFYVYYIDLSAITTPKLKELLCCDFAMIDSSLLMLGRQSGMNQAVYYYDFFDLASSAKYPVKHETALNLFVNAPGFLAGAPPQLHIAAHRKRIDELPTLNLPGYEVYKNAIIPLAEALERWDFRVQ